MARGDAGDGLSPMDRAILDDARHEFTGGTLIDAARVLCAAVHRAIPGGGVFVLRELPLVVGSRISGVGIAERDHAVWSVRLRGQSLLWVERW